MNIFLVTDYAAPYGGNFIKSIKKLEEKVIQNGGTIVYSFPEKAKDIKWVIEFGKNRKVYFHSKNVKNNLKMFKKISKENSINIIYSHFAIPKTQIILKILNKWKKIKLVQHYHNHYGLPNNIFKKIIIKYIFNGDLNIACSESVAKSIPYKNVIEIPNAIDFSRLDEYENIKLTEDEKIVILMFGFDYKRKGVDLAIKALQDIAQKYNIILCISVSVKLNELKQKIIDEFGEIPEFVKFLKPRDDIASYYNASNIYLSASREEGLCYSNIEAVYCGVKCIFSDLEEQPLDIPNIEAFESENSDCLKDKIIKIIENKEFNDNAKIAESKVFVKTKYNLNKWVNDIYICISQMINI